MKKLIVFLFGLFALCSQLQAQNRVVTGKITDEKNAPVANASVSVKGTNIATVSNEEGVFSISVPPTATALVISSVGYSNYEVSIRGVDNVDVKISPNQALMDEVVVVAYGTVKREALTGSVGTIKASEITNRPIANVTRALEGNVPGLVTTAGSGQPGSGSAIRIRGFGSINATSEPLLVVDGIPYTGGTSNINPDDVESITVLKDASSTALYGSRAANGVLMITTKKGVKGRNNINVKVMQGVATRGLQEYDRLDAYQYYPIMWEAYRNSLVLPFSGTGAISVDSANRVASGLTTRTGIAGLLSYNPFNVPANQIVGTNGQLNPNASLIYADDLDWTKDLMRNGSRKDYNINLNGGADKSDYYLSLGYLNEQGYTIKTDLERFSGRLNVNIAPKTWLKTGLNIAGNYTTSNTARDGSSTGFVNPFFYSRNIGPIYPVYAHNMTTGDYVLDDKGNRIWDLGNFGTSPIGTANGIPNRPSGAYAGRHVLAETVLNEQNFERTVISARNNTDFTFLKKFKFTNSVGVDFQNQFDASYDNTLVGDGAPAGRADRESGFSTNFVAAQLLNYNTSISRHRIDVLVGHESNNLLLKGQRGFKQGQSLSGNTELNNFTTINSATSYTDRYRIESYLSRLSYDYDSRYLFNASFRTDGNSRFASESRWGQFWSLGLGWRLDREKFMQNVTVFSALKLRGSYGSVGVADGIGYYAYQGLYGFANNANEPGIVQSQTAFENRKLTWEKNNQLDIGLEFGILKNRITGTIEYYNRESADLLFAVPTSLSSGAISTLQNTATMFNRGIEVQLNGDVVRTRDFTFNLNINASTVHNEITKMPDGIPTFINGTKQFQVGKSQFDYWLRSFYGVDPADGLVLYKAANTSTTANRRIIDNKDGGKDTVTTNVNNALFEYHGSAIPDLYGSFAPTFTYKQISLNVLFTFQLGGQIYDQLYASLMSQGGYGGALHSDILNRWQKPGDVTDVPRLAADRATDFNAASSRWLTDASFLNIRALNISYTLPKSLLSRVKINNGQFFMSAENVFLFSKRKGMNNQQAFSGVTSNAYPPARIITAGLNLNF